MPLTFRVLLAQKKNTVLINQTFTYIFQVAKGKFGFDPYVMAYISA
jgi:hypothetical protein